MAVVPIEILAINFQNKKAIKNAIKIVNSRQEGFKFELIEFESKFDSLSLIDNSIKADDVYIYLNNFKDKAKGFHPHLLGVIDKELEGFIDDLYIYNIFSALEKKNGKVTGNGVITIFQTDLILPNVPMEIYLILYFLSASIRFISNRILIHAEPRDCPFDLKMSKLDLRKIVRKGEICLTCQEKINNYLDRTQIEDINTLLNLISQISNSSNSEKHLAELLSITEKYIIKEKENNELVKEIIEERIEKQESSQVNKSSKELRVDLKKMVGRGNLKDAIEELLNFIDDTSNYFNETILLYARFNEINKDYRKGVINHELKMLEFNKINETFLFITNQL